MSVDEKILTEEHVNIYETTGSPMKSGEVEGMPTGFTLPLPPSDIEQARLLATARAAGMREVVIRFTEMNATVFGKINPDTPLFDDGDEPRAPAELLELPFTRYALPGRASGSLLAAAMCLGVADREQLHPMYFLAVDDIFPQAACAAAGKMYPPIVKSSVPGFVCHHMGVPVFESDTMDASRQVLLACGVAGSVDPALVAHVIACQYEVAT